MAMEQYKRRKIACDTTADEVSEPFEEWLSDELLSDEFWNNANLFAIDTPLQDHAIAAATVAWQSGPSKRSCMCDQHLFCIH